MAEPLAISPIAGEYANAQQVTLSCAVEGAKIFFTTDKTAVSKSKTLYEAPILIETTTTIKARAYKDNNIISNEITAEYVITT